MALSTATRADLLGRCRLFDGLAKDDLVTIADVATEVDFEPGRVIARHGEVGTGFFIVSRGRVEVIRDGRTVAELGAGEFFGELSVLDGLPRIAQVVASEPTTVLALASWDLERVLLDRPALTLSMLRGLAARLRSVSEQQHTH
jgi:CRP-like cAMP-binding protein